MLEPNEPPDVSVLLPVYNGERYLAGALRSILLQTFPRYELIVVDDGSTDDTGGILKSHSDSRIRVVRHARNLGLVAALNTGLAASRGRFIARMDVDDISLPMRLERQVAFLSRNSHVGACGSWFRASDGHKSFVVRTPVSPEEVAAHLFFYCPIAHPTVMMRRDLIERHGLRYDPAALHAEDYDLWTKMAALTSIANVPEVLLDYRIHADQVSTASADAQRVTTRRIRSAQLRRLLSHPSLEEETLHLDLCEARDRFGLDRVLLGRGWLDRLQDANRSAGLFPPAAFGSALAHVWFVLCKAQAPAIGPRLLPTYLSRFYWGRGAALRRCARVAWSSCAAGTQ